MSVKAQSAIPAYQRIQSAIRKRIDAGHLRPGDPVSSERDLAKLHEVSLMTARHALASLEREGIVERRRGVGTFVSAPKIHFNKLMSYTEQMAARSLTAASKILFAKLVDNEPDAAARLSLPPTEQIIKLERLRHASDEPFALETAIFPPPIFPTSWLCSSRFPFRHFERDYDVKLGYSTKNDATAADPHCGTSQRLLPGTLLRIARSFICKGNR